MAGIMGGMVRSSICSRHRVSRHCRGGNTQCLGPGLVACWPYKEDNSPPPPPPPPKFPLPAAPNGTHPAASPPTRRKYLLPASACFSRLAAALPVGAAPAL